MHIKKYTSSLSVDFILAYYLVIGYVELSIGDVCFEPGFKKGYEWYIIVYVFLNETGKFMSAVTARTRVNSLNVHHHY